MSAVLELPSVVNQGNRICLMLDRPIVTSMDRYNRPQIVSLMVRDERHVRVRTDTRNFLAGYHCSLSITHRIFLCGTGYGLTVNEAIRAALADYRDHGGRNPEVVAFVEDAQKASWEHVGVYQGKLMPNNRYERIKDCVTI